MLIEHLTPQHWKASLLCDFVGMGGPGFSLPEDNVDHEVHHLVAVAIFTVPVNEFGAVVEWSDSPDIKGGRVGVTVRVSEDNWLLSVAHDAL